MSDDPDELLLMAYLNDECRPNDREAVEAWIARDPAHRALVQRLRAAWNPPAPAAFDPHDRLRQRLQRSVARGHSQAEPRSPRRFRAVAVAVAAAAAGVAILVRPHATPSPAAPAPVREVTTPRGQRAAFNLADGTRVTLDADSRLRQVSAREVTLVGRAFFQVVHDSARTFRVRTSSGIVEDLGTEFAVAAFPEDRATHVVVASGAVAIHSTSAGPAETPLATLGKGQMASIDSQGVARVVDNADVRSALAWTEGRHVFRSTPVRDVLAELSRWYDVELRVSDSMLLERRLTASFDALPLAQMLDLLTISLGARVERHGRVITLSRLHPSTES